MLDYPALARESILNARRRLQERMSLFDREADPDGYEALLRIDVTKSLVEVRRAEWRDYLRTLDPQDPPSKRVVGDLRLGAARSIGDVVYVQACDVLAAAGQSLSGLGETE